MKLRLGFVSNSSSTAFMITNTSDRVLTLVDFVRENPELIEEYVEGFGSTSYDVYRTVVRNNRQTVVREEVPISQEALLQSAEENNVDFLPHVPTYSVFGDEDETMIGKIFDYALREGGNSENFVWRYEESLR
jgi:hypothetical protein